MLKRRNENPSIYRALKNDIIIMPGTDSIQRVEKRSRKNLRVVFESQTHPLFHRHFHGIKSMKNSRSRYLLIFLEHNI